MSSLITKLLKNTTLGKRVSTLDKSTFFGDSDFIPTPIPLLNVALSGSVDGGLTSGLTVFAGPSKNFKSSYLLVLIASFQKKNPEGVVIFYDSEFGSTPAYFKNFGIDITRVIHVPVMNIEEIKFDLLTQLDQIEIGDKIMIAVDSVGNIASKKEVEDALAEKSVADMTRAKQMKSLFRMVTPYLTLKNIPMVVINHTYETQEMYSKTVMSGGCVAKGTKIVMSDKSLKNIEDICVNDTVLTFESNQRVSHIWNPDTLEYGTPMCYEVEFEDGYKVVCSENHMFMKDNGHWASIPKLNIGNIVLTKESNRNLKITKITPVGQIDVYDISVENAQHYILENGVVSHNTGIMYSSNTVLFVGKSQDKDTDGTIGGYNFTLTVEKSRFVKEKSKFPINVRYDKGVDKYSGLLDNLLEGGYIQKSGNGYVRSHIDNDDKMYIKKATKEQLSEWYLDLFKSTDFKQYLEKKFALDSRDMFKNESEVIPDEIDDEEDE